MHLFIKPAHIQAERLPVVSDSETNSPAKFNVKLKKRRGGLNFSKTRAKTRHLDSVLVSGIRPASESELSGISHLIGLSS